ncbi:MAG: TetR/AcrR family transcriptional regulator [Verrucomicrobiota bacterium]
MSIGRPCEFDPAAALNAAMQVFWAHGYEATSLDDLLRAMGIAKSSFYQAFGSKSELFQRCLTHYRDKSAKMLSDSLEEAPSGLEFIRGIFEGVADGTKNEFGRAGCLVMNTATEFAQRDTAIARLVNDAFKRFEEVFLRAIKRAQQEGAISQRADADSLALFLTTNLGGLKAMARAGAAPDQIRRVVKITLACLH